MRVNNNGFTLIEMVIVIVVLALGLVGVTLVINRTVLQSPQALVQTRAMELAQAYLDDILAKRFDENSGQGGLPRCSSTDHNQKPCSATLGAEEGIRSDYDDVDDYDGISDDPPLALSTDTALDRYDGYSVSVDVTQAGNELGYADNARAKRITVSVTTPLGNSVPVSAYRVNY
jgi:MSHA pilin protein MshD